MFGLISLFISNEAVFKRMNILANFIPEELDINEPPINVSNRKYKIKLLSDLIKDKPELLKLLNTLIIIFKRP